MSFFVSKHVFLLFLFQNEIEELRKQVMQTVGNKLTSQHTGVSRVMESHDQISRDLLKERREIDRLRKELREKDQQLEKFQAELAGQPRTDASTAAASSTSA